MPKQTLFGLALTVVVISAFLTYFLNVNLSKEPRKSELDSAVNQARLIYQQEKEKGRDFSLGPCLSNALMPGWVLDIAHNPRQPADDLPENQCPAYLEGRARHFVELDPDGDLVRAK